MKKKITKMFFSFLLLILLVFMSCFICFMFIKRTKVGSKYVTSFHPPFLRFDTRKLDASSLPLDRLLDKIKIHKEKILGKLKNTMINGATNIKDGNFTNRYNVRYNGKLSIKAMTALSPTQLLCNAKVKIKLETFTKENNMFKSLHFDKYFPNETLLESQVYNSCAVVSSAGSLLNSGLGSFIDSHDIVLRFNNAPTKSYVNDVGNKTSIRIINSQVVAKSNFKFLEDEMYSKSTVLVWDPSKFDATLEEWYEKPDFPFFEQFFLKRLMKPEDHLYLLHPKSMWSLWTWLQSVNSAPLLPNPPSSGFLGIILLLQHCSCVHVFEYIPSIRFTKRCHYYDKEENLACSLGDWHPLSVEKLVTLNLNVGSDVNVFNDGFLTIPGFSTCGT